MENAVLAVNEKGSQMDKENSITKEESTLLEIAAADVSELVDILKCKVMLKGLLPEMWTEQSVEKLQTFILSLNHNLMTCCLHQLTPQDIILHVELHMQMPTNTGIFYFVKNRANLCTTVITAQTFLNSMSYGTVNSNVMKSLQGLFRFLFGPHFIGPMEPGWPHDIADTFLRKFHRLVSASYSANNKLVPYVPEAGKNTQTEHKAMEGVVLKWIAELHKILGCDVHLTSQPSKGPLQEIIDWKFHQEALVSLQRQLTDSKADSILDVTATSQFASEYHILVMKLKEKIDSIQTIIPHLSILKDPCESLEESSLDCMANEYKNLINCVRIICINSTNYNCNDKITSLFVKLGFAVINRCKSEVIHQVQSGNLFTSDGIKILQTCITNCQQWKENYNKAEYLHRRYSGKNWQIDANTCMNPTEAFSQRCRDLIQVSECYDQYCSKKTLPSECVAQHFKKCQEIFQSALLPVTMNIDIALDVVSSEWHPIFKIFTEEIARLDALFCNIVSGIFAKIDSVKPRVHLLQILFTIGNREIYKRQLVDLTVTTYKLYHDELIRMQKEFSKRSCHLMPSTSLIPGEFLWTKGLQQRMSTAMSLLLTTIDIVGKQIPSEVERFHNKLWTCIESYRKNLLVAWQENSSSIDWSSLMDNYLINQSREIQSMIEPNINPAIAKMSMEAKMWKEMNVETGISTDDIVEQWEKMCIPYNHILLLTQNYNRIITSLLEEEMKLFCGKIEKLKAEFNPGIVYLKWTKMDTRLQIFIKRCQQSLKEISAIIAKYRLSNLVIEEQCLLIKDSVLTIPISDIKPISFEEFMSIQSEHKHEQAELIRNSHQEIMSSIENVFALFSEDDNEIVKQQLQNYIKEVEQKELDNFLKNVTQSLKIIKGNMKTANFFLVRISIEGELKVTPSPSEINSCIERFLKSLMAVDYIDLKDVHSKGSQTWESICMADVDIASFAREILTATHNATEQLEKYTEGICQSYEDLWESDPNIVLENYAASNEVVSVDCTRSHKLEMEIEKLDAEIAMDFLAVDASQLKKSLLDCCSVWKCQLASVLLNRIEHRLTALLQWMQSGITRQTGEGVTQGDMSLNKEDMEELANMSKQITNLRSCQIQIPQQVIELLRNTHQQWSTVNKNLNSDDGEKISL